MAPSAQSGSPTSARPRFTPRLILGVIVPLVLLGTACEPQQAEESVDNVILTPTADPATSQTVSWRADDPGALSLEVAPRGAADDTSLVQGDAIEGQAGDADSAHATVSGLDPDTNYQYRIGAPGVGFTGWRPFTTATAGAEPFTFLYFGDVQTDIATDAAPVIRAGLDAQPDAELIVHAGDLVDDANSADQWGEWYHAFGSNALAELNQIPAVGNHEYDDGLSSYWRPRFPTADNGPDTGADLSDTVQYTDYQGVRFVTLNSNHEEAPDGSAPDDSAPNASPPDPAQAWLDTQDAWLDRVLADNPHEWTVVTFHHPLFPNRPDRDNEPLRDAWLDTLEDHDVDLVLQGHDHSYGRGNLIANRTSDPDEQTGPVYVVAVTGSKMYEVDDALWNANDAEARVQRANTPTFQAITVDGDTLEFAARTERGKVVDAFTIVREDGDKRVVDGV